MKLAAYLCAFAIGISAAEVEVKDLGVFSFRSAFVLEGCTNDCLGFQIKLYPSGNITNGYSFHKTNSLITIRDLPLEVPEGQIIMEVTPVQSTPERFEPVLYSFTLERVKQSPIRVTKVELPPDTGLPPIPYTEPGGPLPTYRNANDSYPEDQVKFFKPIRERGLRRNE